MRPSSTLSPPNSNLAVTCGAHRMRLWRRLDSWLLSALLSVSAPSFRPLSTSARLPPPMWAYSASARHMPCLMCRIWTLWGVRVLMCCTGQTCTRLYGALLRAAHSRPRARGRRVSVDQSHACVGVLIVRVARPPRSDAARHARAPPAVRDVLNEPRVDVVQLYRRNLKRLEIKPFRMGLYDCTTCEKVLIRTKNSDDTGVCFLAQIKRNRAAFSQERCKLPWLDSRSPEHRPPRAAS